MLLTEILKSNILLDLTLSKIRHDFNVSAV